jgi:GNAT superfamily N-acetyltransferase
MLGGHQAAAVRVRAWRHGAHAAVCDVLEPWEHGTVVRATRYPDFWDYNLVRVEDAGCDVADLIAFADRALAGLAHRRVDFDLVESGEMVRADFAAAGWKVMRLLWMRHEGAVPVAEEVGVERVEYDAVAALREAWHAEDFPHQDSRGYFAQRREVDLRAGLEVFAVRAADGDPIAFVELLRRDDAAEIASVYVHPDRRGRGLGTAITSAAVTAAGDVGDLWICADDEDRPKHLYARLGFVPIATTFHFTRMPR